VAPSLREQQRRHAFGDAHVRGRWLSDVVLGAQDGIVNTLGVVLGLSAATTNARIVFATGIAAAAAESISMAAVAYTSSAARGALYRAECAREYRHLESAPDLERAEIRAMFEDKGFTADLLERAVAVVCADRKTWVRMMMLEEHQLGPVDQRASLGSAAIVGGTSAVASVLPVLPFVLWGTPIAIGAALGLGVLLLLTLGGVKARTTAGSPVREGVKLAAIGMTSALVAFGIARALAP